MADPNTTDSYHRLLHEELKCAELLQEEGEKGGYCSRSWDGVLCWPPSAPGEAYLQCFDELHGIKYDTSRGIFIRSIIEVKIRALNYQSRNVPGFRGRPLEWMGESIASRGEQAAYFDCPNQRSFRNLPAIEPERSITQNASRWCYLNETWANYSDYTKCSDLGNNRIVFEDGIEITTMIYSVGYGLSLIALSLAVYIFIYYKDLRCLRNTIHTNLMCTYILADFMWILNFSLQMSMQTDVVSCVLLVVLLHYFHLTNFFWMFVEGLYLYMLVVETFTRENIKLRAYLAIGWGSPLLVVVAWAITRSFTHWTGNNLQASMDPFQKGCPWMSPNVSDWIYQAAAVIVLVVNVIFLVMIMLVLITKLRSSNNVETQQYRKATKALLVLIPLLGVTYILFIVGPTEGPYAKTYSYFRSFLFSTQGFLVALFYCFLNTEVQNTLRHHFYRWKETRNVGARRYNTTSSKDWSPNTRTESVRLFSKHDVSGANYRKRESTASETTTLTLVNYSGTNRVSNGSTANMIRAPQSPYLDYPEHAV